MGTEKGSLVKYRGFRLVLATALFFVFACATPPMEAGGKHSVMVILDGVGWSQLADDELPNFQCLLDRAGVGLLNVRSADRVDSLGAFVSLGADKRGTGLAGGELAFETEEAVAMGPFVGAGPGVKPGAEATTTQWEKAGEVFRRRTGAGPRAGGGVQLAVESLRRTNLVSEYGARVGLLGELLNAAGFPTAVLGNSDTDSPRRGAVSVAMDETGRVPFARLGSVNSYDASAPFGRRIDVEKIWRSFQEVYMKASFIVVDWGDVFRAEQFAQNAVPSQATAARLAALEGLDQFLGLLSERISDEDQLIVCSVATSQAEQGAGRKLTPIIMTGGGIEKGYLTSGSTRRPGILTVLDIPASVANYFGILTADFVGQVVYSVPAEDPLPVLRRQEAFILALDRYRTPVLKGYVLFQAALLLLIALMAFLRKNDRRWSSLLGMGLLLSMAVPVALLGVAALPAPVAVQLAGAFLGAFAIAVLLTAFVKELTDRLLVLASVTVSALAVDSFLGGPLIRNSVLGYSATVGARYYGIGNEYMGVFIGSAVMLGAIILEKGTVPYPRLWVTSLHAAAVALLALPCLGANFGGTLAAAAAAFTFGIRLRGRLTVFQFFLAAFVVGIVFGVGYLLTTTYLASTTHIAVAARTLLAGNWVELGRIALRKLGMNWTLVRYTIWTRVLLAGILAWGVLLFRYELRAGQFQRRFPWISRAMLAVFVGAVVAFFANDSGVVATATVLIFGLQTPIYLILLGTPRS